MVNLHNHVLVLNVSSAKDILNNKILISQHIESGGIYAVAFQIESAFKMNTTDYEYSELHDWLESIEIPSFVIIGLNIDLELQRFIFMCDFRLIRTGLHMEMQNSKMNYQMDVQMQRDFALMVGKEYTKLVQEINKDVLSHEELLRYRIVNYILDDQRNMEEIYSFIEKIIYSKEIKQINLIKRCFNAYKQEGIEVTNKEGIRKETVQFCQLTINKYKDMVLAYEN